MLFLAGFLCGAALWALGWSSGGHLFEVPADDSARTHARAAAALLGIALVLGILPRGLDGRRSSVPVLLGLTLGLAAAGLGAPMAVASGSGPGVWLLGALLLTPLALRSSPPYQPAAERPRAAALLPAALSSATLAAGTALLARGLHRALPADGADAAMTWTVFLILGCLGALVLAPVVAPARPERERLGWCAAAFPAAVALGLRALAESTRPSGLRDLLARVGLDPADAGTAAFDALLAAAVLGPAALATGTVLACAREGRSWVALGLGAALGTALAPHLPALLAEGEGPVQTGLAQALVALALASGAAAVAAGPRPGRGVLAGAGAALAIWASPGLLPIPRAWVRFPVDPVRVVEGAAGQLWVEPAAEGAARVRLDHRALTGAGGGEELDSAVLARSLEGGAKRVLLVGQLDLARAAALVDHGVELCDRTGTWSLLMNRVPAARPDPAALLPGEVLGTTEAWRRFDEGAYDLVVVMPVRERAAPVPARLAAQEGCRVVVWLDPGAPLARLELGEEVLLAAAGVRQFAVGVDLGARAASGTRAPAGAPSPRPLGLERLLERPERWPSRHRAAMLERLASACQEEPESASLAPFLEALARVHSTQLPSSPFESPAEAFELDDSALAELVAAGTPLGSEPFARETLMGAAEVLVQKRRVAQLLGLFEPLSEAWGRPARLELALAAGDLEALDGERAGERLKRLDPADPRVQTLLEALEHLEEGH